jgi:hypothetical protein
MLTRQQHCTPAVKVVTGLLSSGNTRKGFIKPGWQGC